MMHYLIREPQSSDPNPGLILMLHGYSSNEQDLFGFAHELPAKYYVVSLRAPIILIYGGYGWYEIGFDNSSVIKRFKDIEEVNQAKTYILNCLEELKSRLSFDTNNVNLIGFSQGAILSFSLALNHPSLFKKVVCMSGYPETEFLKDVNLDNNFSNIELFISHGKNDQVIPVEWARQFQPICNDLNLDYEYHEYEAAHQINSQNYYDMLNFLQVSEY